jgi:hypothetical protein
MATIYKPTAAIERNGIVYPERVILANLSHGAIIVDKTEKPKTFVMPNGIFMKRGYASVPGICNFISSSNVTCSFSSSFTIYETQYKCTLRENEFNFSLNPSIISGSTDGTPYSFVTGSYFSPYVTTVGLYDDNQNLLAVGKLAQPLPTSTPTDTTILINIDR